MKTSCARCGGRDLARKVPGHFLIELALWILFFPAGIIYTLWRLTNKRLECRRCARWGCA
jgi:hypothetical protein